MANTLQKMRVMFIQDFIVLQVFYQNVQSLAMLAQVAPDAERVADHNYHQHRRDGEQGRVRAFDQADDRGQGNDHGAMSGRHTGIGNQIFKMPLLAIGLYEQFDCLSR